MEEVLQDASWLDKIWAEKDGLLSHLSRHQAFPPANKRFSCHQIFETKLHSLETSVVAMARLLVLPCTLPILLLLSIPIFWTVFCGWLMHRSYKIIFPDPVATPSDLTSSTGDTGQTPRCDSAAGTPFFPATPFASPSIANWRDMLASQASEK